MGEAGDDDDLVSVIVPARDAAATIGSTLRSLLSQDFDGAWELVVIDNDSRDATARIARTALMGSRPAGLTDARVMAFTDRCGYASPRNHGVSVARGSFLAFCDADDEVDPGWLSALVEARGTQSILASAQIMQSEAAPQPGGSGSIGLPRKFDVAVAHTGGMAFERAVFDLVGGFDPFFDLGGEDVDFTIRARRLGIEPKLVTAAHYIVNDAPSRSSAFAHAYRNGRSRVRLYARHRDVFADQASGPSMAFRRISSMIRKSPMVLRRTTRTEWLRLAGTAAARLVWSIRLRVPCY